MGGFTQQYFFTRQIAKSLRNWIKCNSKHNEIITHHWNNCVITFCACVIYQNQIKIIFQNDAIRKKTLLDVTLIQYNKKIDYTGHIRFSLNTINIRFKIDYEYPKQSVNITFQQRNNRFHDTQSNIISVWSQCLAESWWNPPMNTIQVQTRVLTSIKVYLLIIGKEFKENKQPDSASILPCSSDKKIDNKFPDQVPLNSIE